MHGFYSLFEKGYLENYKNLRKLSDLGISLKHHVFVENCQCAEFMKFISQVLLPPTSPFFFFCFQQLCFILCLRTALKNRRSLLQHHSLNMSLQFSLLRAYFTSQLTSIHNAQQPVANSTSITHSQPKPITATTRTPKKSSKGVKNGISIT